MSRSTSRHQTSAGNAEASRGSVRHGSQRGAQQGAQRGATKGYARSGTEQGAKKGAAVGSSRGAAQGARTGARAGAERSPGGPGPGSSRAGYRRGGPAAYVKHIKELTGKKGS